MMNESMMNINTIVEITINMIFNISTFPFVISVKSKVKFKNGTKDKRALDLISTMKAIMLGKNEIKVSGVKAL